MAPAAPQSQGEHTNQCRTIPPNELRNNPGTAERWYQQAQEYLRLNDPNTIQLCTLPTWRIGTKAEGPSGSRLAYEHFLHFRVLVANYTSEQFVLEDHVEEQFLSRAQVKLAPNVWPHFDEFLNLQNVDPDVDVEALGPFSSAKIAQNQTLVDALRAAEGGDLKTNVLRQYLDNEGKDDDEDRPARTPFKKAWLSRFKRKTPVAFLTPEKDVPAADEAIVNHALIEYLTALTRPHLRIRDPDNRAQNIMAARWTIQRNKFHLAERLRENDMAQKHVLDRSSQIFTKRYESVGQGSNKQQKWVRLLETQTDGHMYHTQCDEVLAIIEAKKRRRTDRRLAIEWQEAAEIVAMIHQRVRQERNERRREDRGLTNRRGLLKSPRDKNRCLLISQDRDDIYLVVGEWDRYYEYYVVEGKMPTRAVPKPPTEAGKAQSGPARAQQTPLQSQQGTVPAFSSTAAKQPQTPEKRKVTSQPQSSTQKPGEITPSPRSLRLRDIALPGLGMRKKRNDRPTPPADPRRPGPIPARSQPQARRSNSGPQSDSERSALGVERDLAADNERGFLALHVYGPFSTTTKMELNLNDAPARESHPMYRLSLCVLALCLHLAMSTPWVPGGGVGGGSSSGSSRGVADLREGMGDLDLDLDIGSSGAYDKGKGKA